MPGGRGRGHRGGELERGVGGHREWEEHPGGGAAGLPAPLPLCLFLCVSLSPRLSLCVSLPLSLSLSISLSLFCSRPPPFTLAQPPPSPEEPGGGLGLSPMEKKWPHIFRDVGNIVLATRRLLHSPRQPDMKQA